MALLVESRLRSMKCMLSGGSVHTLHIWTQQPYVPHPEAETHLSLLPSPSLPARPGLDFSWGPSVTVRWAIHLCVNISFGTFLDSILYPRMLCNKHHLLTLGQPPRAYGSLRFCVSILDTPSTAPGRPRARPQRPPLP